MSGQDKDRALARQTALGRLARKLATSPLTTDYVAVIRGAVHRLVVPPTKEVEFLIGAVAGFLGSLMIAWLLIGILPLPGPLALIALILPLTLLSGIASARMLAIRKHPLFTFQEVQDMERAEYLRKQKLSAIDQRRQQLRAAGLAVEQIEVQLGPASNEAFMQYLESLDQIKAGRSVLASDRLQKMLDSDPHTRVDGGS